jgi:hypothetical protein
MTQNIHQVPEDMKKRENSWKEIENKWLLQDGRFRGFFIHQPVWNEKNARIIRRSTTAVSLSYIFVLENQWHVLWKLKTRDHSDFTIFRKSDKCVPST